MLAPMSYQGQRRPSLLVQGGAWVGSALAAAGLWWFIFVALRPEPTVGGIAGFCAVMLAWLVAGVVLHELGHLLVGLALGEPVRKIRIGTGATFVGFRLGGVAVQVCAIPFTGGAVYFSRISSAPRAAHLASLAAGPLVNLVAFVYALIAFENGIGWLGACALANLLIFAGSATPSLSRQAGQRHQSDGLQILNLLLQPPVPRTNYEGAEMSEDAVSALARAGEGAQLAGAAEVTDMDLLRALDEDAVVGALFASRGLRGRIPAARIAESDEISHPAIGKTMLRALTAAFQKSRDLGVQKPNAAAFCLGLLAVDCEAGRLLRDGGVDEEALRKLVPAAAEDDEDPRRRRFITPDLPLERWGSAADRVLAQAFRIAEADRLPFVGTQHILAAIVATPESRGAQALRRLGFTLSWTKAPVGSEDEPAEDYHPVLSPQAGLALAGALWRTSPGSSAGTPALLLGIVDHSAGIGAQLLVSSGITARSLEKALPVLPVEASAPSGCTPAAFGLWMLRGSARVGAERWLDARSDFATAEPAATTDFQRALCNNNIAWVSLMSGDRDLLPESLERSRAAVASKPDQPAFVGTHAFALLENGSTAEAARLLEEMIPRETRPRSRALDLCLLAMCHARLGNAVDAAERLAAAAGADPRCPLLGRARGELERLQGAAALSSSNAG